MKRFLFPSLTIVVLIAAYLAWAIFRPTPPLKASQFSLAITPKTSPPAITWPSFGQSALGISGASVLLTNGPETPLPTASTAKLITALTVLQKYPLGLGQSGPTLTLGPNDVALYNQYQSEGGSVALVTSGEKITEYQVLEAMLLPSANNLADSLALWAYGSLAGYKLAAQNYLSSHHLNQTQIGPDASGFNPATVSTASDLVNIGELAMAQPALAAIVKQPSAMIPVAGTIRNVNYLVGSHGVIGIKPGNSDQDKGAYVSASEATINNQPVTIVTAILGAPSLPQAIDGSLPLISSAQTNFKPALTLPNQQIIGHFNLPANKPLAVKLNTPLNLTTWNGSQPFLSVSLTNLKANHLNQLVGYLKVTSSAPKETTSTPLILGSNVPRPSLMWRLKHPLP